MCIALDLIDGNILFVDGTKIRANAARGKNYSKKHYEKLSAEIDERINKLLDECDRIDNDESKQESLVKMKKELDDSKKLHNRVKEIIQQFEEQEGCNPQNNKPNRPG